MELYEAGPVVPDGRGIEVEPGAPERPARRLLMWVFDGEQWTEEGGSSDKTPKAEQKQFRIEEFLPELQVQVVPTVPRTNRIPVPLP